MLGLITMIVVLVLSCTLCVTCKIKEHKDVKPGRTTPMDEKEMYN